MRVTDSKVITIEDNNMKNQLRLCYDAEQVDEEIRKKYKKIYKHWYDMHYRCYSDKLHERYPSYIGCSVCEEWHDFDNFLLWYKENYYDVVINGKMCKMDLDKDILIKNNKIYSSETCIFIPHKLNTLFINGKRNRGEFPLGVWYDKGKKKFRASLGSKKLGTFNTVEQAFAIYKKEKQKKIKELAKTYKNQIPDKLFQAMVHWKVEITD